MSVAVSLRKTNEPDFNGLVQDLVKIFANVAAPPAIYKKRIESARKHAPKIAQTSLIESDAFDHAALAEKIGWTGGWIEMLIGQLEKKSKRAQQHAEVLEIIPSMLVALSRDIEFHCDHLIPEDLENLSKHLKLNKLNWEYLKTQSKSAGANAALHAYEQICAFDL